MSNDLSTTTIKRKLITHAFELLYDRINREWVDGLFSEEYESFTVKQTRDREFIDKWYDEKRELLYGLAKELRDFYFNPQPTIIEEEKEK